MSIQENNPEEDNYSPYCPVCSACGEEGCCSALMCRHDPNGRYCAGYTDDLRFGYAMYDDIMKIIHEEKEKYKELIEKIDGKFDENYDIFYRERFKQVQELDKKENNGDSKH